MAAVWNSLVSVTDPRFKSFSGCQLKQPDQWLLVCPPGRLCFNPVRQVKVRVTASRSRLVVQAAYRDGGRPNNAGIFIGGFVLGGIMAGTLAFVYAPQISKALAETDKKDLMRKLPKFIYDEEKALEKTRKVLTEKIAQLNAAIDNVSSQLRADDGPIGVAVASDDVEAAIRDQY